MADFFETVADFSYFGIFLLLLGINAAPILMPPSWIVLSSFLVFEQTSDPIVLTFVGATGATVGRFILKRISHHFRRFVGKEQKSNLDIIGGFLNRKKYGYTLASFLFAATPLPSNMLFVTYGLMRAKSFGLYVGFWLGRLISYYIMLTISDVVLVPFLELFEESYIGILIADGLGVGVVVFFASIDWGLLIKQRKFRFVKPKIWRF